MKDYKKKYEDALNAARKFKSDCPSLWNTESNPFKGVFEELKESEDERIKRCIGMCLTYVNEQRFEDFNTTLKDCLAWLEKQGELEVVRKPNFCHHEVDFSGCSEEYRKAYYDGWNNCNQQRSQLKAEQKPTWSEKDDYILKNIYELVQENIINPNRKSCVEECLTWLKSIKERLKEE